MTINLINQLTSKKIDLKKYKDTYSAELLKLIKNKGKGVKIKEPTLKVVHRSRNKLLPSVVAVVNKQAPFVSNYKHACLINAENKMKKDLGFL